MDAAADGAGLIRITRGEATEEELAAVVVTLLSRCAARAQGPEPDSAPAPGRGHRRWHTPRFRAPESWRQAS